VIVAKWNLFWRAQLSSWKCLFTWESEALALRRLTCCGGRLCNLCIWSSSSVVAEWWVSFAGLAQLIISARSRARFSLAANFNVRGVIVANDLCSFLWILWVDIEVLRASRSNPLTSSVVRWPPFTSFGRLRFGLFGGFAGFVGAVPGQLAAFRVALNNQPSGLRASSHEKKIKRKISSCKKIISRVRALLKVFQLQLLMFNENN